MLSPKRSLPVKFHQGLGVCPASFKCTTGCWRKAARPFQLQSLVRMRKPHAGLSTGCLRCFEASPAASQKTQQGCESERIEMQSGEVRGEISGLGEWLGNHGRRGFCPALEAACPRGLQARCALWTPTCFRSPRWCGSRGHLSPSVPG